MKFGAQLELYAVPEWQDKYIRYNYFKRRLYRQSGNLKSNRVTEQSSTDDKRQSERQSVRQNSFATLGGPKLPLLDDIGIVDVSKSHKDEVESINSDFMSLLETELGKVEEHFNSEVCFIQDQLNAVADELGQINNEEKEDEENIAGKIKPDSFRSGAGSLIPPARPRRDSSDGGQSELYQSDPGQQDGDSGSLSGMEARQRKEVDKKDVEVYEIHDSIIFTETRDAENEKDSTDERSQEATSSDELLGGPARFRRIIEGMKRRRAHRNEKKRESDKLKEYKSRAKGRSAHRHRLRRILIAIWERMDRIEGFVQLNVVALYKILKKRDKVLSIKYIQKDLPLLKRRLLGLAVPQKVKDTLVSLFNQTSSAEDEEGDRDVRSLSMLVQKQFASARAPASSSYVPFFLGACFVILLDITLAAVLPPTNPLFSLLGMLALVPIFRFALMVTLMVWGAGTVLSVFEVYGVNYKFILDVDPKCQVSSSTMLGLASLLTSIWIIGFGCFVCDAKFGLFLQPVHYWMYPSLVILGHTIVFCLPSRTFRYSYRRCLWWSFVDTLKTAFNPNSRVTLVNNILGDILTSLVKPLLDLQYLLIFFGGLYFIRDPAELSHSILVGPLIIPLTSLLPYWLRLMQCASRYRKESEEMRYIHLANIGKYLASICVIVSSTIAWQEFGMSIYAARLIFVFVYLFASLYNLIWDIVMDWGLMPDPDSFVRSDDRILYPQWLYYSIAVFNLVGRLTWALTLVPISILDDYRFNAMAITTAISSIEIARRSAWLILRLENEHLTNSSRYRAMLWVPKMTSAESHPAFREALSPGGDRHLARGYTFQPDSPSRTATTITVPVVQRHATINICLESTRTSPSQIRPLKLEEAAIDPTASPTLPRLPPVPEKNPLGLEALAV